MTAYGPRDTFLFISGRDVSGDEQTMGESTEGLTEEIHGFGENWERSVPFGIGRSTLSAGDAVYDDRVAGAMEVLQAMGQTRQLAMWGFAGKTIGQMCAMVDGLLAAKFERIGRRDGLTKANPEFVIDGTRYEGQLLHAGVETADPGDTKAQKLDRDTGPAYLNPPKAITAVSVASPGVVTSTAHGLATGDVVDVAGTNTTPTINGVRTVTVLDANTFTVGVNTSSVTSGVGTFIKLTNGRAIIDLHVSAVTLGGFTNVIITPLTSADGTTWVTLGSAFTAVTGVTSQRIDTGAVVVGTVRRYTALSWDFTGAGSGQSITFHVGIARLS